MVKLNPRLLLQGISNVNFNKRDLAGAEKQFHRVTHLHLQNKNITKLTNLDKFVNLTVLYLYENKISQIKGLFGAITLEILYLQKNDLDRVNGLTECTKLQKLFLGYNAIQCLDGLEALVELEELHVEYQRLRPCDQFMIDPISLSTLANCLRVLEISGNQITSLEDLTGLQIRTLIARDNKLQDLDNVILIISTLENLRVLDLRENPVTKLSKYREKLIGYSFGLELLDDKEVSDCSRNFIQSFCRMKAARLKRLVDSYGNLLPTMTGSMTTSENKEPFSMEKSNSASNKKITMPIGISSPMFKNQSNQNQEINVVEQKSKLQLKSQSLQFLLPPKRQEISIPQFDLDPPTFHNEETGVHNRNKNNDNGKPLKTSKTTFCKGNRRSATGRRNIRIVGIEEMEENEIGESRIVQCEQESERKHSISMSEAKFKNDSEFVPGELREAEAHYSEMIQSDFPLPALAKLMLGLHESPRASRTTGEVGDTFEQEKGISWTVMSPMSGSISEIESISRQHHEPYYSSSREEKRPHSENPADISPEITKIEMVPVPVFQKQVYQLPPWPHIIKMGSKESRITYMP